MMSKKIDIQAVADAWVVLVAQVGDFGVIKDARNLNRSIALLDRLLDETHGDWCHPLVGLIELMTDRIEAYESTHLSQPVESAADVLRLLMESNGLTQSDLAPVMGGQSVVSAVLNGHRAINAKQAAALAQRFCLSPAAFIDMPNGAAKPAAQSLPAVSRSMKTVRKAKATASVPTRAKPRIDRAKLAAGV